MSEFADVLEKILPAELPHREVVIAKSAAHLAFIEDTNRHFNLTRITGPHEAAIKHVLDSVMPWRLFTTSQRVLDAGTGAGFPGIPLAAVLPDVRFTLAESIQKKARFAASVVEKLDLLNVTVRPERAEELIRAESFDVITARALAPLPRALGLFAPALRTGARLLLYKGPDVDAEITEAAAETRKRRAHIEVVMRYDLPEDQGTRTIVQITAAR